MNNVTMLLNTSVADAKSSLECQLQSNPQQALNDAQACFDVICARNDGRHFSRRAMLITIINKANKALKAQQGER
ncbi:hypothetical protein ACW5WQ_21330 [Aeromonas rivuli]|uniref:hypothetical protein n=1 Tax=Aeromonas rivuli TaxID=648794 RepID=UPI0005A60CFD|nr:hypothetical protein [Aeromonas rivuli]